MFSEQHRIVRKHTKEGKKGDVVSVDASSKQLRRSVLFCLLY